MHEDETDRHHAEDEWEDPSEEWPENVFESADPEQLVEPGTESTLEG